MSFAIRGLGTAVPDSIINDVDAMLLARRVCCRTVEQSMTLPQIYKQTGIKKRHMALDQQVYRDVLDGTRVSNSVFLPHNNVGGMGPTTGQRLEHYVEYAGPLAIKAARIALERSGLSPRQVTHLVTVSCTGFCAPGVDIELIKSLLLPATTQRTHVGFMGCHGALNGLRVAHAITGNDPDACVLLCAVELCSIHFQFGWEAEQVIVGALFADGAGAVVGTSGGHDDCWRVAASGSCLLPDSTDDMTWKIGDRGFRMTLSKRVPELIGTHLRPWLVEWLDGQGLGLDEIASWALHPGGPKILSSVQEALGLPAEAIQPSLDILSQYGNMSSATILFLLDYLKERQAPRPCVALGFGPGLTAEAALFA